MLSAVFTQPLFLFRRALLLPHSTPNLLSIFPPTETPQAILVSSGSRSNFYHRSDNSQEFFLTLRARILAQFTVDDIPQRCVNST